MPEITVPSISINVPLSSLDDAWRERGDRIVSLEAEHDAVLAAVGPLDGETLAEAVSRICREREGARADASSAVAIAIRQALGAKPDERTVDAAGRVVRERDEARKDLAVAENTLATALRSRDEWFDAHESMRQERDAARADLIVARGLDQTVRDILKLRDGVSLVETVKRLVGEREYMRQQRDAARQEANTLTVARDELKRERDAWVKEHESIRRDRETMRRERDEALVGLARLLDTLGAKDFAHAGRIMVALTKAIESLGPFEEGLDALHAAKVLP